MRETMSDISKDSNSPLNPWKNIFKYSHSEELILEQLKNFPPFSDLTKKELKMISKITHVREYNQNETVYLKGDPGVCFYLIEDGKIQIFFDKNSETQMTILDAGDFLGEFNLFIECERTETAVTLSETRVLIIFRPDMLELIKKEPRMGLKILLETIRILSERYKTLNENFYKLYDFVKSNKVRGEYKNEA